MGNVLFQFACLFFYFLGQSVLRSPNLEDGIGTTVGTGVATALMITGDNRNYLHLRPISEEKKVKVITRHFAFKMHLFIKRRQKLLQISNIRKVKVIATLLSINSFSRRVSYDNMVI